MTQKDLLFLHFSFAREIRVNAQFFSCIAELLIVSNDGFWEKCHRLECRRVTNWGATINEDQVF